MNDHFSPDAEGNAGDSTIVVEVRAGAYFDSVVLMQLQRALSEFSDVFEAGVAMGTPANKELLAQSALLTDDIHNAAPEDLILVVRARSAQAGRTALREVDALLAARRHRRAGAYQPKTLAAAARMIPEADWVVVSVPGRYAASVAGDVLTLGKNVFLYSDNVSLDDEISLKESAAAKGLLVMGPDCGTARVAGVGLGFANRVRRGRIGIVAASGTGMQAIMVGIHRLGGGISQAYGTGGRDMSAEVKARTAKQALARLKKDTQTDVIVVVSKPPAAEVAQEFLVELASCGKPVVVNFIGYKHTEEPEEGMQGIFFARTLDEAAELAVRLAAPALSKRAEKSRSVVPQAAGETARPVPAPRPQSYLRALYSGGTLAYEALHLLQGALPEIRSTAPLPEGLHLANPHCCQGHSVLDLGADDFTVGRLHPMLDNDLRIRRLLQEARDPQTGIILMDVILGDGAHPDPASELAPAIAEAIELACKAGRKLPVVVAVIGTDEDPQGIDKQIEQLERSGALVFTRHDQAVQAVANAFGALAFDALAFDAYALDGASATEKGLPSSPPAAQDTDDTTTFACINIGIESFTESFRAQSAEVVHVDWRPPAGGNERLARLLTRLR